MQGYSSTVLPPTRKRGRGDSWEPLQDSDEDAQEVTTPNSKRRRTNGAGSYTRGIDLVYNTASTLLNTAAEAVVFCTVLGMAAYRIWSGQDAGGPPAGPPSTSSPVIVRRRGSTEELQSPLEAIDRPPAYDSIYLVSDDPGSRYQSRDRSQGRRRTQYQASSNAARRKRIQIVSATKHSPIRTIEQEIPSPAVRTLNEHLEANDIDDEDGDDELFASMSSRVQAMIQQGNQALQYSGVAESHQTQISTDSAALQRRKSMPVDRVSMIPFPSAPTAERRERGHRARASMG